MSTNENNISTRLKTVIELVFNEKGRVKELERLTEIPASSWKNFLNGQQKATISMVEKISQILPTQAFWIATGITDFDYGHSSPDDVSIFKDLKSNATNEFFLEEIKSSNEKITKIMTKGLKVLASLNLIDSDQVPATNNASFYQTVRWIEIFLDRYLLRVPIDAAIEIFNQLRVKVNSLSNTEIDDQQQQLIASLDLKFSIKKEELERLINQINLAQDKRIATYDHQAT